MTIIAAPFGGIPGFCSAAKPDEIDYVILDLRRLTGIDPTGARILLQIASDLNAKDSAGQYIFHAGDHGDALYLSTSGEISILLPVEGVDRAFDRLRHEQPVLAARMRSLTIELSAALSA